MGLKGDFDEVGFAWRRAPPLMKTWLVLSLFLASSSVASLSDTIIKWKGFFLDAMSFYEQYVSVPIHGLLLSVLPYQLPREFTEVFILFVLLVSSNIKLAFHFSQESKVIENAVSSLIGLISFAVYVMVYVIWKDGSQLSIGGALSGLVTMAIICSYWHSKTGGPARVFWYLHLFGPLIIISLLGAINTGLKS